MTRIPRIHKQTAGATAGALARMVTVLQAAFPWAVSGLAHVAALATLGLLAVSATELQRLEEMVIGAWSGEEASSLERLEQVAAEAPTAVITVRAVDLQQGGMANLSPVAQGSDRLVTLPELLPPQGEPPLKEVRSLLETTVSGQELYGNSFDDRAAFFGVEAIGYRFVFLVDKSHSMTGKKWQAVRNELLACVKRLREGQSFYVILFDTEAHRMFDRHSPAFDLVAATPENVDRLRRWLFEVTLEGETKPCEAVRLALTLAPDAVFLLTDGEFEDPTAPFLRGTNRSYDPILGGMVPRVIVHTIGCQSTEGESLLMRIAEENGGTYKHVP